MKKTLAFILALCLCVGLCACSGATSSEGEATKKKSTEPTELLSDIFQYPAKNEEWEYDVYERHVVLTKYIGSEQDVIIPETLDGLPVTELKESDSVGSGGCFSGIEGISTVTLSNNIKKVAGFEKSSIQTIIFASDDYVEFDRTTFNFCHNIQNVEEIIEHIPGEVFPDIFTHSESKALHTIVIPERFTTINRGAFWGCTELTHIDVGNVSKIEDQAFGKVSLLELRIHNKECDMSEDVFAYDGNGYRYNAFAKAYTRNMTIYAPAGSAAARFASEYSIDFVLLEE